MVCGIKCRAKTYTELAHQHQFIESSQPVTVVSIYYALCSSNASTQNPVLFSMSAATIRRLLDLAHVKLCYLFEASKAHSAREIATFILRTIAPLNCLPQELLVIRGSKEAVWVMSRLVDYVKYCSPLFSTVSDTIFLNFRNLLLESISPLFPSTLSAIWNEVWSHQHAPYRCSRHML